jgi:hypothetical protein
VVLLRAIEARRDPIGDVPFTRMTMHEAWVASQMSSEMLRVIEGGKILDLSLAKIPICC